MLGKQEPNEGARKPRNFQVEPTRRHSYTFAQAPYNNFLNNSSNNFGELARSSTSITTRVAVIFMIIMVLKISAMYVYFSSMITHWSGSNVV